MRIGVAAHVVASGVLTVSVVGDSLFYAIIPAAAVHYGLGAAGISLVLSINRFVRLALNPILAAWLAKTGLRRGAIVGALLAVASTASYAVAPGVVVLAIARAVWGAAFSLLRLTMLGYATVDARRAAERLGVAFGLHALVPAIVLVAAASLLGALGPRGVFWVLAAFTLLAIPLAWSLPRRTTEAPPLPPPPAVLGRPPRRELLRAGVATTSVAFGTDGLVTAGTVLAFLAGGVPAAQAATLGALVLALRKVLQVVVAPIAGRSAQRWGITPVVAVGMVTVAIGLATMATGSTFVGAVVAVAAAAVVQTLTPAVLAAGSTLERMRSLGWITTARDLGAAVGAAYAPLFLVGEAAATWVPWTFGVVAALVVVATMLWIRGGDPAAG